MEQMIEDPSEPVFFCNLVSDSNKKDMFNLCYLNKKKNEFLLYKKDIYI